ncbi:MAG TPA: metallophosphoesterase [Geobacteraceae bacterium]|nr:metallophosphoesterase [Geobacteraceae bacterium]
MSRFIIFYFVFYGGAHAYVYLKLWSGLPLSRRAKLLLTLPLALLFIAPLLARTLDQRGFDLAAGAASSAGYWWMGLMFLFVSFSLPLDTVNLLLLATKKLLNNQRMKLIPAGLSVALPACYAVTVAAYGWQEARTIRTEQVTLVTPKIPSEIGRVRLVQISDVHAGQIVREKRIREILRVVAAASPDLVISTGDLVDGHQKHFKGLEPLFRGISAPLGKYAVTGNHEFYVGLDKAVKFTEEAGFKVLMDENAGVGDFLTITGVADPSNNRKPSPGQKRGESDLLAAADKKHFVLLLKHRPEILQSSRGLFDLQLSGHVHKGQIFPFNIITWLAYPIRTGLSDLEKGSQIYVSRGTGVWGPPIRFLAPPEVTVIDLVAGKKPSP